MRIDAIVEQRSRFENLPSNAAAGRGSNLNICTNSEGIETFLDANTSIRGRFRRSSRCLGAFWSVRNVFLTVSRLQA